MDAPTFDDRLNAAQLCFSLASKAYQKAQEWVQQGIEHLEFAPAEIRCNLEAFGQDTVSSEEDGMYGEGRLVPRPRQERQEVSGRPLFELLLHHRRATRWQKFWIALKWAVR